MPFQRKAMTMTTKTPVNMVAIVEVGPKLIAARNKAANPMSAPLAYQRATGVLFSLSADTLFILLLSFILFLL